MTTRPPASRARRRRPTRAPHRRAPTPDPAATAGRGRRRRAGADVRVHRSRRRPAQRAGDRPGPRSPARRRGHQRGRRRARRTGGRGPRRRGGARPDRRRRRPAPRAGRRRAGRPRRLLEHGRLLPILAERSLLACSASATATSLTAGNTPATFFRTALRDDYLAGIVADQVMFPADGSAGPATVMIVGRDDVYGNELTGAPVGRADRARRRRRHDHLPGAAGDASPTSRRRSPPPHPTASSWSPYTEAPNLISQLGGRRLPGRADRRPRRAARPAPRRADVPRRPDPGRRADRHRHDRRPRPDGPPAPGAGAAGPDVLRRADVRLRDHPRPGGDRRRAPPSRRRSASRSRPSPPAGGRARRSPTASSCWRPGEDIDYDGTTGRIDIDGAGDISSARITTSKVIDGQLQPTATQDLDLVARRQQDIFASAVFVTQLQQALKVLGYFEGDITGVYDDATTAAVAALQTDLGLPDHRPVRRGHRRRPARPARRRDSTPSARASPSCSRRSPTAASTPARSTAATRRQPSRRCGRSSATSACPRPASSTSPRCRRSTPAASRPASPASRRPRRRRRRRATAAGHDRATASHGRPDSRRRRPRTRPRRRRRRRTPSLRRPVRRSPSPPTRSSRRSSRCSTPPATRRDLAHPGPLTFFAPTNEAFDTLDEATLDELTSDPVAANELLRDLAVEEALTTDELTTGTLPSFGGFPIDIDVEGDEITVEGAPIVVPNIVGSNGIAHGIGLPIPPPESTRRPRGRRPLPARAPSGGATSRRC